MQKSRFVSLLFVPLFLMGCTSTPAPSQTTPLTNTPNTTISNTNSSALPEKKYLIDARNVARDTDVKTLLTIITQYVAVNGVPPPCLTGTSCDFSKATLGDTIWGQLYIAQTPIDPKKKSDGSAIYYKYGYNAAGDYEVAATLEGETPDKHTALVLGSRSEALELTGAGIKNGAAVLPYRW